MRVLFIDSDGLTMCAEVYNANEVRDIDIIVEAGKEPKTYSFDSVIEFYVQGDVDERHPICLINSAQTNQQILKELLIEGYADLTQYQGNLIFYPDKYDIPDLERLTVKYGVTSRSEYDSYPTRMSF